MTARLNLRSAGSLNGDVLDSFEVAIGGDDPMHAPSESGWDIDGVSVGVAIGEDSAMRFPSVSVAV